MVAHFSPQQQPGIAFGSAPTSCLDPEACARYRVQIDVHMTTVCRQAEKSFTTFLNSKQHRIICLDEAVIDMAEGLGLSWRDLALAMKGGSILWWHDQERMPSRLQALARSQTERVPTTYPTTLRHGRQARSLRVTSVLDLAAQAEYRLEPGRYSLILRCAHVQQEAPLLVGCSYQEQPVGDGASWVMQVISVCQPARNTWTRHFEQLTCWCFASGKEDVRSL